MIAWKPMVVYGGPNYLHRPWGPAKPNLWGQTHPVAWGPPQQTNIETSGFDAPNDSDYGDDYEQGNLLEGMTTGHWSSSALELTMLTMLAVLPCWQCCHADNPAVTAILLCWQC